MYLFIVTNVIVTLFFGRETIIYDYYNYDNDDDDYYYIVETL